LANHTILAIVTGTAHRWTTNNGFSDHPSFMVVLPFVCGFLVYTKKLNNNIAILYERNELWINENAYGVIKSLMESPIWI
jgi:hypothetical protein